MSSYCLPRNAIMASFKTSFNIKTTLKNKNYFYPNFANEKTVTQDVK